MKNNSGTGLSVRMQCRLLLLQTSGKVAHNQNDLLPNKGSRSFCVFFFIGPGGHSRHTCSCLQK